MSSSGVRDSDSTESRIRKLALDRETDKIESLKPFEEIATLTGGGQPDSGEGSPSGNYMKRDGDEWSNLFGNEFDIGTIDGGFVNVSKTTGLGKRLTLLNPEGGLDDILDTINVFPTDFTYLEKYIQIQNKTVTLREPIILTITNIVGNGSNNIITVTVDDILNLVNDDHTLVTAPGDFSSSGWVKVSNVNVPAKTFTFDLGRIGSSTPQSSGDALRGNLSLPNGKPFEAIAGSFLHFIFDTASQKFTLDYASNGGSGGNIPDATSQYQHIQSDGNLDWIAQQELEFGALSAGVGEIRIPNNTIGIAWRNALDTGDIEIKAGITGSLDITRNDNLGMDLTIRSQHLTEADQSLSITVGSGSITTASVSVSASTAKLIFAAGGSPRLTLDTTTRTDLILKSLPGVTSQSSFSIISTHVSEADQSLELFVGSGNSAAANIDTSAGVFNIGLTNTIRWSIDVNVGNVITQTAFNINPIYDLFNDDSNPQDNELLARINFSGRNSIGSKEVYASILADALDISNNTEDGSLSFSIMRAGVITAALTLNPFITKIHDSSIELDEIVLPTNPSTNRGKIYLRDVTGTTTPFFLDSNGTEISLIGGGGGASNEISAGDSNVKVVDTGVGSIQFTLDGAPLTTVNSSEWLFGMNLDVNSENILNVNSLGIQNDISFDNGFSITNTSVSITTITIGNLDDLIFKEGAVEVGKYDGGSNTWTFNPTANINLDPGGKVVVSGDIEMQGVKTIDFGTNASSLANIPAVADGYFQIKRGGSTKFVPFFNNLPV